MSLGLEIMQDETHLLQRHFDISGNEAQRVASCGLKKVRFRVPGQRLWISLPEGEGLGQGPCGLQVNYFEGVEARIVRSDRLFIEAYG